MNQMTDRKTLETSTALAALTRVQRLQIAADALTALPKDRALKTLFQVEKMQPETLAAHTTDGTIFAPIVDALNVHGVPTNNNMGSVMRNLEITQRQVHRIGCFCIESAYTMSAENAAGRMQHFADLAAFGKA